MTFDIFPSRSFAQFYIFCTQADNRMTFFPLSRSQISPIHSTLNRQFFFEISFFFCWNVVEDIFCIRANRCDFSTEFSSHTFSLLLPNLFSLLSFLHVFITINQRKIFFFVVLFIQISFRLYFFVCSRKFIVLSF